MKPVVKTAIEMLVIICICGYSKKIGRIPLYSSGWDAHVWVGTFCVSFPLRKFMLEPTSAGQVYLSSTQAAIFSLGSIVVAGAALTASTHTGEIWQHKLHHSFFAIAFAVVGLTSLAENMGYLVAGASSSMASCAFLCAAALLLNHPAAYRVEDVGHHLCAYFTITAAVSSAGMSVKAFAHRGQLGLSYSLSMVGVCFWSIAVFFRTRTNNDMVDIMTMYLLVSCGALTLLSIFILRLSVPYARRGTHSLPAGDQATVGNEGVEPTVYGVGHAIADEDEAEEHLNSKW